MEKADAGGKGRIVLATVKGDVHDIGKNLVDIILTNNGYEVHNLGIKVADRRDDREGASRSKADAIGMSGLLVKSTLIMRENLEELNEPRPRRDPGAARRRRAHPHLRRARPARGLRGPAVLRQGRVRGPAHDGHAHGGQARAATLDPDFGRVPGGRELPPAQVASSTPTTPPVELPGALRRRGRRRRSSRRRSSASRVVKGISLDDIAGVHQRDRAVPQPVAVPARQVAARPTTTFKDAHPPDAARAARRAPRPRACSCPRSSTATSRSTATATTSSSGRTTTARSERLRFRFPRQREGAVPLHRRLLPARSSRGERRLRRVPHRHDGRTRVASATAELFADEPVPGVPAAARPRRRDGRGARRAAGTAASARSGASPTRTARRSPACSASSTAAAATRGATPRAPTSRTRRRSPSCSTPTASASTLTEEFQLAARADHLGDHLHHPEAKYFVV